MEEECSADITDFGYCLIGCCFERQLCICGIIHRFISDFLHFWLSLLFIFKYELRAMLKPTVFTLPLDDQNLVTHVLCSGKFPAVCYFAVIADVYPQFVHYFGVANFCFG